MNNLMSLIKLIILLSRILIIKAKQNLIEKGKRKEVLFIKKQ